MDIERIRVDFPILKHIIYMDSAATSLTPEPVLEAVSRYYREYCECGAWRSPIITVCITEI